MVTVDLDNLAISGAVFEMVAIGLDMTVAEGQTVGLGSELVVDVGLEMIVVDSDKAGVTLEMCAMGLALAVVLEAAVPDTTPIDADGLEMSTVNLETCSSFELVASTLEVFKVIPSVCDVAVKTLPFETVLAVSSVRQLLDSLFNSATATGMIFILRSSFGFRQTSFVLLVSSAVKGDLAVAFRVWLLDDLFTTTFKTEYNVM